MSFSRCNLVRCSFISFEAECPEKTKQKVKSALMIIEKQMKNNDGKARTKRRNLRGCDV